MASVQQRGKMWWAYWKQDGITKGKRTGIRVRQEGKTIKETRIMAKQVADMLERAAKGLTSLDVLQANLRAVANANGFAPPLPSITDYLDTIPATARPSSERNRQRAFATFREFLGERQHLPLNTLNYGICRDFVIWDLGRVRRSTARQHATYVSAALKRAVHAERYLDRNPMEIVSVAEVAKAMGKADDTVRREAFTTAELRRLMDEAPAPWSDMVAVSYYLAGLRISDVATLAWASVDFGAGVVSIREVKTGRQRVLTLHPHLRARLERIRAEQGGKEEYVFPDMAARYLWRNGSSSISPMFSALLRVMGIVSAKHDAKVQQGAQHSAGRKSFHSIRHAVVSIARTDPTLTPDVVRETVGHTSEAVEQGYFHASVDSQRRVLDTLAAAVEPGGQE